MEIYLLKIFSYGDLLQEDYFISRELAIEEVKRCEKVFKNEIKEDDILSSNHYSIEEIEVKEK